ncbi:MAG: hypothetical protein HOC09_33595 [Deltaproteobacteria bacterium]|jgi:hypothetical protein|nr:hypothetical protein [Deltaproteobacteria bacterium]
MFRKAFKRILNIFQSDERQLSDDSSQMGQSSTDLEVVDSIKRTTKQEDEHRLNDIKKIKEAFDTEYKAKPSEAPTLKTEKKDTKKDDVVFKKIFDDVLKTHQVEKQPAGVESQKTKCVIKQEQQEDREIVIGFDFGTSCSKVVVQDTVLRKAYTVEFNVKDYVPQRFMIPRENQPAYQLKDCPHHLLPSRVYCNSRGSFSLEPAGYEFSNLKINLIEELDGKRESVTVGSRECTHQDIAIAFIALVLIETRNWFCQSKADIYKKINILWQFNVGLPAGNFETNLSSLYRQMSLTAWNLSLVNDSITISKITTESELAEKALSKEKVSGYGKNRIHPDYVNIIPEILAEVYGCYVKTPMRQNGMYLLVDVGARTLDISTFMIYHFDHEDRFTVLSAEVHPLGSYSLHTARTNYLSEYFSDDEKLQETIQELEKFLDGLSPLPDVRAYFKIQGSGLLKVESQFKTSCTNKVWKVLHHTRRDKNSTAKEWDTGVPVLLCGGGSKVQLYKNAVSEVKDKLQFRNSGFRFISLPQPKNLEILNLDNINYHRVAVAYGLSFLFDDYGQIKKGEDIKFKPRFRDTDGQYASKEMT